MVNFKRLKAVIWDMDGVLVNSEATHQETWRATFEKFNLPIHPERLKRSFGMTSEMVVKMMVDAPLSEETLTAITQEKSRSFQQAIKDKAVIFPGVLGWLETFKRNHIRQAVASSGRAENIRIILESLAITDFFDVIVDGEGLPSKPEPFIFHKTADLLDVNPLHCLVIEDSAAGITAAKAAGMVCVAVATTSPADQLKEADHVIDNLAQLMNQDVQALFSR